MKQREKRKFIRYDSLHLLDYLVLDEEGKPGIYSMGRTIDVSLDGLKLETTNPFPPNTRLLITVGIEDDLIDLEGQTTHAHPQTGCPGRCPHHWCRPPRSCRRPVSPPRRPGHPER